MTKPRCDAGSDYNVAAVAVAPAHHHNPRRISSARTPYADPVTSPLMRNPSMTDDWKDKFTNAFPALTQLLGGDDQEFDFSVRTIRLFGGAEIPLQQAGVTAIVGPNNAGKSTVLRETWAKLTHRIHYAEPPRIVVKDLDLALGGEQRDLLAWLGKNSSFTTKGGQAGFQRSQKQVQNPQMLTTVWKKPNSDLGSLASFLGFYGDAQGRFGVGGSAEMRQNVDDPPEHPVHYLQDSRELLDELSAITAEVFGQPLTLDTLGRMIRVRVGKVDMEAPPIDAISAEYRSKMASLRPLDEQGDGMRSMLGQLLPVVTAAYKLIILDEPEAFLHPPQAHALGVQLGRIATRQGLQIVLATHDRNLLTGLLDSGVKVSVVRLSRDDGSVKASPLNSEQLKELWTDPVLKYTNVLDGLFHRLVAVTEAEGDCAYLAAALDWDQRAAGPIPRNEILMVPTGGKDGMAKVCSALNAVKVPIVAAPDLDMLKDKKKLKELVQSLGEDWTDVLESLWVKATAGLNAPRDPATVGQVLAAVNAVLEPKRSEPYSRQHKADATAQLRAGNSPWDGVKEHGMSAFKGEARRAATDLVRALDKAGVVLVEAGELERLAPEVAVRKGPGWLQAALTAGEQYNPATQHHVDRIVAAGQRK